MPGPYIHQSSMRHVASRLVSAGYKPVSSSLDVDEAFIDPEWTGLDLQQAGQLLQKYPNYACLGAIGPDLFTFLPDFPKHPWLAYLVEILSKFWDIIDPFIEWWNSIVGPVTENNDEFMSRVTGGLSESVEEIFSKFIDIIVGQIEGLVVSSYDVMGLFSVMTNQGYDEQSFTWMDMLHYRSTGHFGRALWEQANLSSDGDLKDKLRAYALGYITHLGTDVTGHPFVNAIASGPYREHWNRHHLVETQSESFWYLADPLAGAPKNIAGYPQYTESALYFDISFDSSNNNAPFPRPKPPKGGTLRQNYDRKNHLDKDSDLPSEIADLLQATLKKVFYASGVSHPNVLPNGIDGLPTTDQISEAFGFLYSYLKLTTCDGFDHERPGVPEVWGNLDLPNVMSLDLPPGLDDADLSLLDFAFSLICLLYYIGEIVAWVVSVSIALVADVATYAIRYLLYLLELQFFYAVKTTRAFLVLMGYLAPMEDEIALGLVQIGTTRPESYATVRAEMSDVFGGIPAPAPVQDPNSFGDKLYPHIHETKTANDYTTSSEYLHPWSYPQTPSELSVTIVSPYAKGADPSVLFNGTPTDPNLRDQLTKMSSSPDSTDSFSRKLTPQSHLGDAPNFSMYLIWLLTRDVTEALNYIVDFNLDGDRGYAYKCWDWIRNTDQSTDPLGHKFNNPVTWPSQSGHFDPKANLQIEYLPRWVSPVIK